MDAALLDLDNGAAYVEHAHLIFKSLSKSKLKFVIHAHSMTEMTHAERFAEHPVVADELRVERELLQCSKSANFTVFIIRCCLTFDYVALWFSEELKKGQIPLPEDCALPLVRLALSCLLVILINNHRYLY